MIPSQLQLHGDICWLGQHRSYFWVTLCHQIEEPWMVQYHKRISLDQIKNKIQTQDSLNHFKNAITISKNLIIDSSFTTIPISKTERRQFNDEQLEIKEKEKKIPMISGTPFLSTTTRASSSTLVSDLCKRHWAITFLENKLGDRNRDWNVEMRRKC